MRPRRDISRPTDEECLKKIVVEGLKLPFQKDGSVRSWLCRYGNVEEVKKFHNSIVVKFSSEFQAADAARCESGIRSSGSSIKVHLANSDGTSQTVGKRNRGKRSSSPQHKRSVSSGSRSSSRLSRRPRIVDDRDDHPLTWLSEAANQASRLKEMVGRPLDIKKQLAKYETSMQEVATSSIQQQQHRHHSDNRMSTSCRTSSDYDVAILAVTHDLVQYAEAVQTLLYRRAAEEVDIRLENQRQWQRRQHRDEVAGLQFRLPRVKIMVLMSVDHIAPCMHDLSEEGVLFAILLTVANMTHNSCTLRILYSPTQQEHRNMPLPEAINLLLRDFADYLEARAVSPAGDASVSKGTSPLPLPAPSPPQSTLQRRQQGHQAHHRHRRCRHLHRNFLSPSSPSSSSSSSPSSSCTSISSSSLALRSASSSMRHPQKSRRKSQSKQPRHHCHHRHHSQEKPREAPPTPDDPSFLAPSRHITVLLRMLADSRILSVGELDEISAFISQRRARLTSELTAAVNPGAASNAALKARVLETLYPSCRRGGGGGGIVTSAPSSVLHPRRSLPVTLVGNSTERVRNSHATATAEVAASGAAVAAAQPPSPADANANGTGDAAASSRSQFHADTSETLQTDEAAFPCAGEVIGVRGGRGPRPAAPPDPTNQHHPDEQADYKRFLHFYTSDPSTTD